jgi:hypothetical protein
VFAAVFLLVLAATGIALNHTEALKLDQRFVAADWLLGWYGMPVPEFGPSFEAAGRNVTQLGTRVYVDDTEMLNGVTHLIGAAVLGSQIVIGTADTIAVIDRNNQLIDRIGLDVARIGAVRRLAVAGQRVIVESTDLHSVDLVPGTVNRMCPGSETSLRWPESRPVPPQLAARLTARNRGDGLSLERLLLDLHSGRVLNLSGRLLMDLAALAVLLLAVSGFWMWWRR